MSPNDAATRETSAAAASARAELRACLAEIPPAKALAAIYPAQLPGARISPSLKTEMQAAMRALAATLPNHQTGCLEAAGASANTIERIAVLAAGLLRVCSDTVWLHHNAAYHLALLVDSGVAEAGPPCLMHCALGLQVAAVNSPALPFLRLCLARRIAGTAPREAIANAVAASSLGHGSAMDLIRPLARRLGITVPDAPLPMTISKLRMIEARCQLPPSCLMRTVAVQNAVGITAKAVTNALTAVVPPPPGGTAHSVFLAAGQTTAIPQIGVFALEDGIISFDMTRQGHTQFYVFDSSGACIESLCWGVAPFIAETVETVPGDLAVIDDQFSGTMNICHFLLDHLTRIALYDAFTGGAAKILFADPYDTYRAIVARAGLADRMHEVNARKFSIRAGRLLIASNIVRDFLHPAHHGAPWALKFLRERFAIPRSRGAAQNRRIFISRGDAKLRHIVNVVEVEALAAELGFEVLMLSALPLDEQIAAFAEADCVTGVHGAGFTNIVFSPPGLRVLEILPPMVASGAYWRLANAAGHEYAAMVVDDPEFPRPDYAVWGHHPEYNDRDVVIHLHTLRERLTELVG